MLKVPGSVASISTCKVLRRKILGQTLESCMGKKHNSGREVLVDWVCPRQIRIFIPPLSFWANDFEGGLQLLKTRFVTTNQFLAHLLAAEGDILGWAQSTKAFLAQAVAAVLREPALKPRKTVPNLQAITVVWRDQAFFSVSTGLHAGILGPCDSTYMRHPTLQFATLLIHSPEILLLDDSFSNLGVSHLSQRTPPLYGQLKHPAAPRKSLFSAYLSGLALPVTSKTKEKGGAFHGFCLMVHMCIMAFLLTDRWIDKGKQGLLPHD